MKFSRRGMLIAGAVAAVLASGGVATAASVGHGTTNQSVTEDSPVTCNSGVTSLPGKDDKPITDKCDGATITSVPGATPPKDVQPETLTEGDEVHPHPSKPADPEAPTLVEVPGADVPEVVGEPITVTDEDAIGDVVVDGGEGPTTQSR